jgi:predicted Zn-dependent protease
VALLPSLTGLAGLQEAVEAVQAYVERHPESLLERYMLANLLYQLDRPEEARPEIDAVIESREPPAIACAKSSVKTPTSL